jgi:hypothetical protein
MPRLHKVLPKWPVHLSVVVQIWYGKVTNLLPVLTVEKYSASKYILSFSTDISLGITKQKPVVDSPERGNETSDPINGSEFYDERLIGLLHRF